VTRISHLLQAKKKIRMESQKNNCFQRSPPQFLMLQDLNTIYPFYGLFLAQGNVSQSQKQIQSLPIKSIFLTSEVISSKSSYFEYRGFTLKSPSQFQKYFLYTSLYPVIYRYIFNVSNYIDCKFHKDLKNAIPKI